MIPTDVSVVINQPVEKVFAYVTNWDNDTRWQSDLLESQQTSKGPLGVGTTGRRVQRFLGRRFESTNEITEYELNRKVGFRSTSGPIRYDGSYTFESVEGGTKFTWATRAETQGFFKITDAIGARMYKRQVDANLKNLKDLIEAEVG